MQTNIKRFSAWIDEISSPRHAMQISEEISVWYLGIYSTHRHFPRARASEHPPAELRNVHYTLGMEDLSLLLHPRPTQWALSGSISGNVWCPSLSWNL